MSDLLGPLLGMSPLLSGASINQAQHLASAANTALAVNALSHSDLYLSGLLNTMAPPEPGRGIHWRRTGGKSWRVVIVR